MIQSSSVRNVLNFVLFQIGWLVCVLYPGMLTAATAFCLVGVHLVLVSQRPRQEFQFIVLGTAVGALLDGLWFRTGVMTDTSGAAVVWTPVWIVGVWAVFMTTLAHSLSWVKQRVWLPYVLAPIAGPFAYWSASRLGAVTLPDLTVSLLALALGWFVVFPLLLHIQQRFFRSLTP
ncbi:DUF2878 domain-containing protein [Marinobacter caseinilyticus]|uniref:DUF2878 domain-containing protein n=1 Tax=Marinobacter caseinilyticus TaxID=2692195 RepID=UPI00140DE2AE|nr:DUF2878 domain-containing protein [Marinobacter caseinilyticus]